MKRIVRTGLIAALLASSGVAAARPDSRHGPQRPSWHEQQASHGHKWRKGQRLAPAQRRYVVSDWSHRGLRAPPRGYQWVRENNNNGDYLLVAAATGLIASILSQ
jgi:Ni/Co efflux regulator RcnB